MGATYDDVVRLQFEGFGFKTFTTKPLAVDECTIGTFDVLDVNLENGVILMSPREKQQVGNYLCVLFPYFGMLSAENF